VIWEDVKGELKKLGIVVGGILVLAIAGFAVVQHFRHPDFTKDVAKSEQLDTAHVARHVTRRPRSIPLFIRLGV
jgi:hypothetical protein